MNSQRFVNYYVNQAGGGSLDGFVGAPVMYVRGLGSMLSRAFRFVLPFRKRGANLAKPYFNFAAKGIASGIFGAVASHIANRGAQPQGTQEAQEGSGLLRLASRRKRTRSTQPLSQSISEKRKGKKRRKKQWKTQRKVKSQKGGSDIF